VAQVAQVVPLLAVAVAVHQLLELTLVLAVLAVPVTVAFILGEVNHDTFCNN
jgi:hypothetical protein